MAHDDSAVHGGPDGAGLRTRVVLLGASNLTRALSAVVETSRLILGAPLDIYTALGHGRAYGLRSRVLVRSLPGIVSCGLWPALERADTGMGASVHALVTDAGNDLLYGADAVAVAEWIGACVDRLTALGASTVLTQVPLESVRRVGRLRYRAIRSLLFPGSEVGHGRALAMAEKLAERLEDLAARPGVTLVRPAPGWYGLDPIHLRRRCWAEAWPTLLASWRPGAGPGPASGPRGSLGRWLALRRATPELWWRLGRERSTPQPSARLRDGTRVSMF